MFEESDIDCKIMGDRKYRNPEVPGYWFKLRGRLLTAFPTLGLNQTCAMFEMALVGYFL
jgi:hypothetical protein